MVVIHPVKGSHGFKFSATPTVSCELNPLQTAAEAHLTSLTVFFLAGRFRLLVSLFVF